jgi:hypothetical protein
LDDSEDEEQDDSDGNEIISDEDFRLMLEENNEIIKKYV